MYPCVVMMCDYRGHDHRAEISYMYHCDLTSVTIGYMTIGRRFLKGITV